ncbi:hypothetical protein OROMI_024740 [Orobanche minor]
MANQSSSHRILCASFNQDNSCFAIGTRDGFRIFDCETGRLLYERGAFMIVEMLYRSSLLAIVGAGQQPSLSPRRLCLFNTVSGTALRELNFLTSILAVRVNRKRLIVLLHEQIYIYDANSLEIKRIVDMMPNLQGHIIGDSKHFLGIYIGNSYGLCAFSENMDNPYLAVPASTTKGSVLVYNVMDLQSHCEIHAHRSPLAAMTFSSNGMYIATASEQGTIIRVHLISEATKRKSNSFLGSIMPGSVSDALDPAHHLVFHHAFAAGVRSDAVVRKTEKASGTSMSEPVALRRPATVSVIAFSGCFQEYGLRINHKNEATWTLENEFNLLTAVAGQTST